MTDIKVLHSKGPPKYKSGGLASLAILFSRIETESRESPLDTTIYHSCLGVRIRLILMSNFCFNMVIVQLQVP